MSTENTPEKTSPPDGELPLSPADFRLFNKFAVHMDSFHNMFRDIWTMLDSTCKTGSRPAGMSIRTFISQGLGLCRALEMHHTIEERYIFPDLAVRMPDFAENEHLILQHKQIHEGIERLQAYLTACTVGERELRLPELRSVMESFGDVLWTHMDDEVRRLGAESMRKYWSREEMMNMSCIGRVSCGA